jgi:hypothetical protein
MPGEGSVVQASARLEQTWRPPYMVHVRDGKAVLRQPPGGPRHQDVPRTTSGLARKMQS